MARKNTITPHIKELLTRCDELKHFAFFTQCSGDMVQSAYQNNIEKLIAEGQDPESFGHGTAGAVINLFERGVELGGDVGLKGTQWESVFGELKELPLSAPFGGRMTSGEALLEMQNESNERTYSQLLCLLHEVWETYIKKVYATILFQKQQALKRPQLAAFHQINHQWRSYRNTPKYFQDYANFACRRDCEEAYKQFACLLDFDRIHYVGLGVFSLKWVDIVELMAICRNQIVHCDGVFSDERLQGIKKPIRVWIEKNIRQSSLTRRHRIMISHRVIDNFIGSVASYGYALFALSTEFLEMERDYCLFPTRDS